MPVSETHAKQSAQAQPKTAQIDLQEDQPAAGLDLPADYLRAVHRPERLTPSGVLSLQRLVGNRAVSHAIWPVSVQQRSAQRQVQRLALTSDQILAALTSNPKSIIARRLNEKLHLRRAANLDDKPEVQTMLQHVQEVLRQYDQHQAAGDDEVTSQAMALATVLEGVARVIAVNELNDPGLTPTIATLLIQYYRKEFETKLGRAGMPQMQQSLNLAGALVGNDALSLYMHDELNLELTARHIRRTAEASGQPVLAFFELLRKRFEIEMASYKKQAVANRQPSGAYNVSEATGELSTKYLQKLFNDAGVAAWVPRWQRTTVGGQQGAQRETLNFTLAANQKLNALRDLLAAPPPVAAAPAPVRTFNRPNVPGETRSLTANQTAHLEELEQQEAAITPVQASSRDDQVADALKDIFGINLTQATALREVVRARINTLPITISVKSARWFGAGQPTSTLYKPGSSRGQETKLSKLFPGAKAKGTIKHLGEFVDDTGQDRPLNYNRFRAWKDQKMTGNREFSDQELPVFGAAQLNWAAHSSQASPHNKFAVNAIGKYGINSYGDVHFHLRRENIANRIVFTATDHGFPHRDMYLAFCDFVLANTEEKSLTGQKIIKRDIIIRNIVNSLTTNQLTAVDTQVFEFQLFGELDVAKDVSKISLAPSVQPPASTNAQAFCAAHGIQFEQIPPLADANAFVTDAWFKAKPGDAGPNLLSELRRHMGFWAAAQHN